MYLYDTIALFLFLTINSASVYGQGHIVTFGGARYRMYGPGDFILVTVGRTMVQGRFEENPFIASGKLWNKHIPLFVS